MKMKMIKTDLGNLRIGDVFCLDGEKYQAKGLGNNDINNVFCLNINQQKHKWLDVQTKVDIQGENNE